MRSRASKQQRQTNEEMAQAVAKTYAPRGCHDLKLVYRRWAEWYAQALNDRVRESLADYRCVHKFPGHQRPCRHESDALIWLVESTIGEVMNSTDVVYEAHLDPSMVLWGDVPWGLGPHRLDDTGDKGPLSKKYGITEYPLYLEMPYQKVSVLGKKWSAMTAKLELQRGFPGKALRYLIDIYLNSAAAKMEDNDLTGNAWGDINSNPDDEFQLETNWGDLDEETAAIFGQQLLESLQADPVTDGFAMPALEVPQQGNMYPADDGHSMLAETQSTSSGVVPPPGQRRILKPYLRKPSPRPQSLSPAAPMDPPRGLDFAEQTVVSPNPFRRPLHLPPGPGNPAQWPRSQAQPRSPAQPLVEQHIAHEAPFHSPMAPNVSPQPVVGQRQHVAGSQHGLHMRQMLQHIEVLQQQRHEERQVIQQAHPKQTIPGQPFAPQSSHQHFHAGGQQSPFGPGLPQHSLLQRRGSRQPSPLLLHLQRAGPRMQHANLDNDYNARVPEARPDYHSDMGISPVDLNTAHGASPPTPVSRLWDGGSITDLINHSLHQVLSGPEFSNRQLNCGDLQSICSNAIRQGFIGLAGIDPDRTRVRPGGPLAPYNRNGVPSQNVVPGQQSMQQRPGTAQTPRQEDGRLECLGCKKEGKETWLKPNSFDRHYKTFHQNEEHQGTFQSTGCREGWMVTREIQGSHPLTSKDQQGG
ncbi:hypothetical protein QBC40DRAFT_294354 [Triangularia verruculosa]|uniref:Uncharacterized protein n=1 Tax=Triangularia verruculosa TaxID=2587418 RepID=A0AAN6XNS4_9PEZI|nr:hypothetical protein QBC40DRAFT_294354 [Triangularia verruculosa]